MNRKAAGFTWFSEQIINIRRPGATLLNTRCLKVKTELQAARALTNNSNFYPGISNLLYRPLLLLQVLQGPDESNRLVAAHPAVDAARESREHRTPLFTISTGKSMRVQPESRASGWRLESDDNKPRAARLRPRPAGTLGFFTTCTAAHPNVTGSRCEPWVPERRLASCDQTRIVRLSPLQTRSATTALSTAAWLAHRRAAMSSLPALLETSSGSTPSKGATLWVHGRRNPNPRQQHHHAIGAGRVSADTMVTDQAQKCISWNLCRSVVAKSVWIQYKRLSAT